MPAPSVRPEHSASACRATSPWRRLRQGPELEDLFEQIQRGETATLNIVLKADVQGSLEAVTESLKRLEREDVKLSFVLRGIGGITENDVQLAAALSATIIGFNVRPDKRSRELAETSDVEIRTYEIIYKLLEDIEAAMLGLLSPLYEEVVTGEAEVREVFRVPRVGAIAGCYVREGKITRGSKVRFLREGTVIWKGAITSLRRFKDDAREVAAGFECGIGLSDFQDLKAATSSRRSRSARSRGGDVTVKRRTATYPRSLRVNQVLRQVMAEELERLADADERFRMVTVTSVDTAADMRTATVYLAALEPMPPMRSRSGDPSAAPHRGPGDAEANAAPDVQGRPGHRRRIPGRRAPARPGRASTGPTRPVSRLGVDP